MKPVDVKSSTYIDFNKENNKEDPKFKVGDHVRIWSHKSIFGKGCISNWSEDVFVIKNVKVLCHRHILLVILMVKKLFYEKLQKMEKVIKRKDAKLHVKWKGYVW